MWIVHRKSNLWTHVSGSQLTAMSSIQQSTVAVQEMCVAQDMAQKNLSRTEHWQVYTQRLETIQKKINWFNWVNQSQRRQLRCHVSIDRQANTETPSAWNRINQACSRPQGRRRNQIQAVPYLRSAESDTITRRQRKVYRGGMSGRVWHVIL